MPKFLILKFAFLLKFLYCYGKRIDAVVKNKFRIWKTLAHFYRAQKQQPEVLYKKGVLKS